MIFDSDYLQGLWYGVLSSSAFVLYNCLFKVEEGYLAILTEFGKAKTLREEQYALKTHKPGLGWKLPWQKVHRVSMMEQSLHLTGEHSISAMAEDGTLLKLEAELRYVQIEKNLYSYMFALKKPLEHIHGLFTCLLRNEIAGFTLIGMPTKVPLGIDVAHAPILSSQESGSYALIRKERRTLNARIEKFCQSQIDGNYGVQFCAVDLTDILPPDELADALNAVINAQIEAEALFARAEGECQQRFLSAKKGVAISRSLAHAAETEILTLAKFLIQLNKQGTLPQYIERRRSEVLLESRSVFRKVST